jgi:hypothetical protein
MGRTLPTYRMLLEEELTQWKDYRRALRKKDQEVFDELLKQARTHSSASGYHVTTNIFEPMVLTMILEQKKEINRLKKELDAHVEK